MKKLLTFLSLAVAVMTAMAAPVSNMPAVRIQPNGDTLRCWVSGDEFFHRLHDAQGYTIVQDVKTGQYVYADLSDGVLVPTAYVPGQADPAQVGLKPNLMPSVRELQRLHHAWDIPPQYRAEAPKTSGTNHGTLNNVVIFIRFNDETACTTDPFDTINAMFNDSTAGVSSMYNYFKTTSYNKLHVVTTYRPAPSGTTILSYQDSLDRSYYMPYSATNTDGYTNYNDRRSREFGLLQRAVNWVNNNCPIPTSVDLDMDDDGYVDNICFVVSGTYTGWSDLLWPHKWSLYDRYVYINGKRVYTFNLQLAGSGSHYFSVSTFCHEMTHTLGAPDIYNYYHYTDVTPGGSWDLMCSNQTPPQQTNALFKIKYLNWFDSIPQITDSGSYTLHSLATGCNRAYKIASQDPDEWYILEYRNTSDTFDSSIPGRGLLIWRYNDSYGADNANFNNVDTLHELWLFRPNSNHDTVAGLVAQAAFGIAGRSSFNAGVGPVASASNPYPYLCNGQADTTFYLSNIQVSSDNQSVSFTYSPNNGSGCGTVTTFPETMDFEDGHTGCWRYASATTSNDDRVGVYATDGSHAPHGGSYQFRFSSYASSSDYNQYLISPRLQPANPLHLVFYYQRYSSSEQFRVKYSTTGDDMSDFTHTLTDVNVSSNGWQRCDVLVPDSAQYVAINYYSNYLYYLYIDDISLTDTLQETVVRDTTYIYVHDTLYYDVHDTVVVTVYDTNYVTPEYCEVVVYVNDTNMGTVSGNGTFVAGTEVEIAAMAKEGYVFDRWRDGNFHNPRTVVADSYQVYSALFVPEGSAKTAQPPSNTTYTYIHDTIYVHDTVWLPNAEHDTVVTYNHVAVDLDTMVYYTLTVLSADTTMGVAAGSGRFPYGTQVELGAVALPGYRLLHWEDMSLSNPKVITVTGDMTFTAYFEAKGTADIPEVSAEGVSVYAQGSAIVVETADAARVEVYNVLGQQVYGSSAPQERTYVSGLRNGLYLVKVDGAAARKVVVLGR